ncbi:hypothetical protein [Glycomyces salinus]|uniref:hypothetical protein n=1 Tax=Glycomyces salinus TaxID=980294 RepID=UPI0018ECF178|nr:hypothetical protein [Glycomyces salinus]
MAPKRLIRSAMIVAAAASVFGMAAPAAANPLSISGSGDSQFTAAVDDADGYSVLYDNKRGVEVCDTSFDGWDVYSDFYVRNDSEKRRVSTSGGEGSCARSGSYSAGIDRHNTCLNRPLLPDACSDYRHVDW